MCDRNHTCGRCTRRDAMGFLPCWRLLQKTIWRPAWIKLFCLYVAFNKDSMIFVTIHVLCKILHRNRLAQYQIIIIYTLKMHAIYYESVLGSFLSNCLCKMLMCPRPILMILQRAPLSLLHKLSNVNVFDVLAVYVKHPTSRSAQNLLWKNKMILSKYPSSHHRHCEKFNLFIQIL